MAGSGQRLGPRGQWATGTVSSRASSGTNKMVWHCTEPCCPPQWAPCPQPETLTRPSAGGGERGRGTGLAQSPGWPCRQLPAAQSQPNPHSGLALYLTICFPGSSLLLALRQISQVISSYRTSLLCGASVLHPSGLLSPCLCLAGLFPIFRCPAILIRRFCQNSLIISPSLPCRPQQHTSLTNVGSSGISPGNSLTLWLVTTLRSALVTHTGTQPPKWRWPHATGGTSGRVCMDTVPASGLIRQHEECGLHISRTRCFPLGIWAPSQPWPRGWPASDPFGHQAMLAAGVENTGSKLARRGSCPAGSGKGRTVTEGGGVGSAIMAQATLLPYPSPRTTTPYTAAPDILTPS